MVKQPNGACNSTTLNEALSLKELWHQRQWHNRIRPSRPPNQVFLLSLQPLSPIFLAYLNSLVRLDPQVLTNTIWLLGMFSWSLCHRSWHGQRPPQDCWLFIPWLKLPLQANDKLLTIVCTTHIFILLLNMCSQKVAFTRKGHSLATKQSKVWTISLQMTPMLTIPKQSQTTHNVWWPTTQVSPWYLDQGSDIGPRGE